MMTRQEHGELGAKIRWNKKFRMAYFHNKRMERAHKEFLIREAKEKALQQVKEEKLQQHKVEQVGRLNDFLVDRPL